MRRLWARLKVWVRRPTDHGLPSRRRWDTWRGRAGWVWDKGVPLVAVLIAGYAVLGVQGQRQDAIRIQCRDQNIRNKDAVDFTLALFANPALQPSEQQTPEQEQARHDFTIQWVNKLVPRRDCEALVKQLAP